MQDLTEPTIVAIATPLGVGGISVVRMSGSKSWEIAYKISVSNIKSMAKKTFQANHIYPCWITDLEANKIIDQVIILPFKSPKSYTGEDIIEIQCHGGTRISHKIIKLCLRYGALMAEAGEFTKRAFLNGHLDLTQVEAVLDVIHAKTDIFSGMAAYNLSGKISEKMNLMKNKLMILLANIMASVDFPDEIDELHYDDIHVQLIESRNLLLQILKQTNNGNIFKEGIKISIIGRPNVGKSSLFNKLLNKDRAIVTDIPGTTRDILDDMIDIDGIPVILIDTAGIRSSNELVETIGIDRSKQVIEQSDLVLFLYDLSSGFTEEDQLILDLAQKSGKQSILIGNKRDIANTSFQQIKTNLKISTQQDQDLNQLKTYLRQSILGTDTTFSEQEGYINLRQQNCLNHVLKSLNHALEGVMDQISQDLITIDLKDAIMFLGELSGEVLSEEIVDEIFKNFCVGK